MLEHRCDNCYKMGEVKFEVASFKDGKDYWVCSVSCLCEIAWELRDREPKLSKSKMEADNV